MYDAFNLLILGLLYGATVCSLSCMPYFAPYLISSGRGFKDGLASSFAFVLGKICSYTFLGGIAAIIGQSFTLNHSHYVIMGITMIGVALTLPLVNRGGCHKRCQVFCKKGALFILGIVSSMVPCPPLVAVFLLAAKSGTLSAGVSYGFFYGLGLTLSPMLIVGGGFAMVSEKIKQEAKGFAPFMQGMAMLMMFVMAANMIMTV